MMDPSSDWPWMQRALELAERGRGWVEPNPLVGAVLVRDGAIVGEGWHERYGAGHAETNAIAAAGTAAKGATLYVTLEPCCHHGKTPPCTDAILVAGIQRVVAALEDPFPKVAGKGSALLRAAGLKVAVGLGEKEARRQNAAYLQLVELGRPYVHAKWAMSLDGKIATRTGQARWISGDLARRYVHELRGKMDAIVVGGGTALADDPQLTARPPGQRIPARIVLLGQRPLPPNCRLLQTPREGPVILVQSTERPQPPLPGCEVLTLAAENGRPSVTALLSELGRRRMTNILLEGGAELLGSFLDARAINEVHVFIAPRLIGGSGAKSAISGLGVATVAEGLQLAEQRVEVMDGDVLIHGYL